MTSIAPQISWAQRNNLLYVTVNLADVKEKEHKLENDKLFYKAKTVEQKEYEVTLDFYDNVKIDDCKVNETGRLTEFIIYKEEEKWWPRLLKQTTKFHWLKLDFNKWQDEDDVDEEMNDNSYESMMKQLGAGGAPDFSNFNMDDKEDSDEEQLPDLE